MKYLSHAAAFALLLGPATAIAGPVAEFETQFRDMYQTYRAALFQTNTGQAEPSAKALAAFADKWDALRQTFEQTPPPHYADDAQWGAVIGAINDDLTKAQSLVASGDLPGAHEALEDVRDTFWALHKRNSVETFSDRMNAYHAEMEHVLAMDLANLDSTTQTALVERAAVMAYLAADLLAQPPVEAAGNAEFGKLAAQFRGSVEQFQTAARTGAPGAIRAAVDNLKKPYAVFFLKFG